MDILNSIKNIGQRNHGDIIIGVYGICRIGKSTLIKKIMENVLLPLVDDKEKENIKNALPLTNMGNLITTTEIKFIPSTSITLQSEEMLVKWTFIDNIGYVIPSTKGYLEEGKIKEIKTPWFNELIPFDDASKIASQKILKDHANISLVCLSDGSINSISRQEMILQEEKMLNDLLEINLPFLIILNTKTPLLEQTLILKDELEHKYHHKVIPLDIEGLNQDDFALILDQILLDTPLNLIDLSLPKWVNLLDEDHYLKISLKNITSLALEQIKMMKDSTQIKELLQQNEYIENANIVELVYGEGKILVEVELKEGLFDHILEELIGCNLNNKEELFQVITSLLKGKKIIELLGGALESANATGYGFAPGNDLRINKPELNKISSRHSLKIKATTSCYHLIKVDLQTTFEPALGNKMQADYFLDYLNKAYEEDPLKMLECEIFGKKFLDILNDSINGKLNHLPEPVKRKLNQIITTLINKNKSNLIALVF